MLNDGNLNIRQLQVFEAVARLESYSRAQQELGISVSAICKRGRSNEPYLKEFRNLLKKNTVARPKWNY